MRLLLCLLAWPLFSIGQDVPVKELLNQFTHRNDTQYLQQEWKRFGFPHADYLFGSYDEFSALGRSGDGGKTIKDYIGVYIDFAENIHEFNNRTLYYRTGSKQRYQGWGKALESLGFALRSWERNEEGTCTVYTKGPVTATTSEHYELYKKYVHEKQAIYSSESHLDLDDIGYVLAFEIRPSLSTGEVFDLFEKRRDTAFIIKALRDHGFTEHQSQKDMIAVLGYQSRSEKLYSENFTVFLNPGNLVCYKTGDKKNYDSWKSDLLAKGFEEAPTTGPGTVAYRKDKMDALVRNQLLSDGTTTYLLYLRLNP